VVYDTGKVDSGDAWTDDVLDAGSGDGGVDYVGIDGVGSVDTTGAGWNGLGRSVERTRWNYVGNPNGAPGELQQYH